MSKPNLQAVPAAVIPSFETAPQGRAKVAFAPYAQSPLHAFGLPARAEPQNDSYGVWMNEMPLLGYILVRGDAADAAFQRAVRTTLDIELPVKPNTFVPFPQGVALWQGPDEWLLVCARPARAAYQAELEAALRNLHAQVADNSGGLTTVYLSGRKQVELLRHVGVYDFESLQPGEVASTVCGKAGITVYRHDTHGIFVIFRRSFSDYLWRLFEKAARPYGLGITQLAHRASHPVLRLL
jgi:sarcosine oxidase, subunit gamma